MKKFTIKEIKNYILKQDSLGDVLYNLSEEKIEEANTSPAYETGINCTCGRDGCEGHICPKKSDVDGDNSLCNCCPDCEEECRNDI